MILARGIQRGIVGGQAHALSLCAATMAVVIIAEIAMPCRIHPDAVVFWTTAILCLICLVAV